MSNVLIPVVLCGGSGSRLWPLSREAHPKPFIRLNDGQSFLQKAFLRALALPGVDQLLTVCNRELFFKTKDELREIMQPEGRVTFVLEPVARNTAAAIAVAALQVQQTHGAHALMLVLPADHVIADQAAFAQSVAVARELANQGRLVTFGVRPTRAETGYGYIEAQGHEVIRFVEKPSLELAQAYVQSGRYLWNAGMFCFNVQTLLEEMAQHCPGILEAARLCMAQALASDHQGMRQVELPTAQFEQVPEDSIDYAVMEKSRRIAVVPCDMGWNDVGTWPSLGALLEPDALGNRLAGQALLTSSANCTVFSPHRLVAAVGVHDLMIVDTPDALLVAHKDKAQDVKQVFQTLKRANHEAHRLHRTVHRPWGTYTVLEEGKAYKIKRIEVKPGASLSLQKHHHRSEHWVVVSGSATVTLGDSETLLSINQAAHIPVGQMHRLHNPGKLPLIMIEVQSGEYLGEDDIVRLDDRYGRQ